MIHYDAIEIVNFQGHKNTVLKPSLFTAFWGESEQGKSAILRALRWLMYNLPDGDDYRYVGSTETRVTVWTNQGNVVSRIRTASINRYILNDEVYEGFGRNKVPQDIQDALGVCDFRIDHINIPVNYATQLAGPFLGSSVSAQMRAKFLGKLAGAEILDRASRAANVNIIGGKTDATHYRLEVDLLEKELSKYQHLPELKQRLDRLEKIEEDVSGIRNRHMALIDLKKRLTVTKQERQEMYLRLGKLAGVDNAQARLSEAAFKVQQLERLKKLREDLDRTQEQEKTLRDALKHLSGSQEASKRLQAATEPIYRLEALLRIRPQLRRCQQEKKAAQRVWDTIFILLDVEPKLKDLHRIVDRIERLKVISDQLKHAEDQTAMLRPRLQALNLDAIITKESIDRLLPLCEKLGHLKDLRTDLTRVNQTRMVYQTMIAELQTEVDLRRDQYTQKLKEAGQCPLCGGIPDEKHIMEVV